MQSILVILLVSACILWLAYQGYRFFRFGRDGRVCGGRCCDGAAKPLETTGSRTQMIAAEDLRRRLQARK